MAGYRSKKIMADRYADPITLDHIIELKKQLEEAERQRDNALDVLSKLRKDNEELQEQVNKFLKEKGFEAIFGGNVGTRLW